MTESAIKSDINDQFPTPGIDNDSQVFRDNFSTIKASLASAKTEIDQFLSHGVRNDIPTATMNGNILSSYVSMAASDFHYHITGLQVEDFDLSYKNGLYQTVQIGSDLIIGLTDFPKDTIDNYKVGKVRLHLTADLVDRHVTFMTSSALIMYNDSFPFYESNKLTIRGSSTGIATIVDIWQVNNGTSTPIIYLEYVGLFQDTSKPIFQKATVDVSGTRLLMAYNESLSSVTAGANTFTVMVDGMQKQVSTVTAASTTVTLIFTSAIQKGQTVTFSYDAPLTGINAIKDSIGNKAISLLNETVENLSVIDTVSPVFQSAEVSANGTTLRLLYNELLNSTTAASTQFTVTVNGASITVDNVAISQSTVILSLGITVQLGQTVTVSYTAPLTGDNAIKDVAGNKTVDLTNRSVINNSLMDTISPVLLTAAVNANGDSFVLTYDEPLNTTTASKSDFVIGGTSAAISNVTAAASAVTLTMSPAIQAGQPITLRYVRSDGPIAIKDLADNKAANFALPDGNISIANNSTIDTTPPMVSSTAIDATGLLLAITFDEPLKTTTAGASAFTVTVAGNSRSVSTVAASGSIVTLTLASAVQTGQPVTVNYTKPSTGNAIEDPTGNKTVDFAIASGSITNGSTVTGGGGGSDVTPPVFQSAAISTNGLSLVLTYDETLSSTTAATTDFVVNVNSSPVTVSSVAASGSAVTLTLASAINQGQTVTIAYNAPAGTSAIKDIANNKAITLTERLVNNNSTVTNGGGSGGNPPATPSTAPESYVDNLGPVTSNSSTAATTDDTTPGINIPTGLTDTVKLYNGNDYIPAIYNSATGALTPSNALPDGQYAFKYTLSNQDGESGKSPAINITIAGIDGGWYATNQIPTRRDGTNLASDRIYGISPLSTDGYVTVSTQFDMPGVFHGSLTYYTNNTITHQINLQDITDTWLHGTSVAIDSSNNVYVAGDITRDGFVRKYSSTGNLIWAKKLDVSTSDSWYRGYARVHVDHADNMILVGNYGLHIFENNDGTNPGFIAKYNSSNALQWAESLADCYITGCAITSDNKIGVVGSRVHNFVVAVYDNAGELLWKRSGGTILGVDQITDLKISSDSSGNFYVSGTKDNAGVSPRYGFIVKYSPTGSLEWTKALSADTIIYAMQVDSSDRIHIVGTTNTGGLYAVYNTSGILVSKREFNVSTISDIAIDSLHIYLSYNIYIGGLDYASGVITLDPVLANNILGTTAAGITISNPIEITEFDLTFTDTDATDLVRSPLVITSFPDDSSITQTTDIELTVTGGNAR